MISISYLKPLSEACNITGVNHITSERECVRDSAWKRVKAFVGVTMTFTKVISKLLRRQNFAVVRKNLDGLRRHLPNDVVISEGWIYQWICDIQII